MNGQPIVAEQENEMNVELTKVPNCCRPCENTPNVFSGK